MPPTRTDAQLVAAVARRYHLQGQSKVEIARWCGVSRFKVARLLEDAREQGIVTITVRDPEDGELGAAVAERLGVARCVVVHPDPDADDDGRSAVAHAAGRLLPRLLHPGDRLGLTWSRSVDVMVGTIDELPPCTVVQLAGSLHDETGSGTADLARRAALLAGGRAHPIHAPLVVTDPAAAQALRSQPGIADTLALADRLSVSVVAVGAWRSGCSTVYDTLGADVRDQLAGSGAVAEISGRLLAADGTSVDSVLDPMIVGVSADQLRSAPERMALVVGPHRAGAVLAAARAGMVTTLVTTVPLAHEVLAAAEAAPPVGSGG